MPLVALRPSLPASLLNDCGFSCVVVSRVSEGAAFGFRQRKRSHHHKQQWEQKEEKEKEEAGFANNAKMLPNLRRCGGRAWRASVSAAFEESGRAASSAQRQRLGAAKYEHLSFKARGFDGGAVEGCPIVVRSGSTVGECHGCARVRGRVSSCKIQSSAAFRQVNFGWKRRERNGGYGWNGESTTHESQRPKRCEILVSHLGRKNEIRNGRKTSRLTLASLLRKFRVVF